MHEELVDEAGWRMPWSWQRQAFPRRDVTPLPKFSPTRTRIRIWSALFADYEILQPFPQLGRPTFTFDQADSLIPQPRKHVGREIPVGKILGLTNRDRVRGAPQDNSVQDRITRPLPSGGALVASLDPGIMIGAVGLIPEVEFSAIWFSATGEGSWTPPEDGTPDTFDIDPVTASELLAELESLHS